LERDGATVVIWDLEGSPPVDVSSETAVGEAAARLAAEHGRVDVLVNNAGVYPHRPFEELTYAEWRRVLQTNLDSVYLVTHALYPAMRARGYGRIVSISSAAVHVGPPGMVDYLASKAGILGFTRSLASEAGAHGVTVNAVTPGFIETPGVLADPAEVELFDLIVSEQAIPRRGVGDDVAACVAYLASPEAGFITGQTINVDGGHRFI
jgi:3-oxoacyl-[acyl-carrier protein] reductase